MHLLPFSDRLSRLSRLRDVRKLEGSDSRIGDRSELAMEGDERVRILLVEDDERIAGFMKRRLERVVL